MTRSLFVHHAPATIIDAADLDAALGLATVHPQLTMPGGCEIEGHEAQPIRGCEP